MYKIKVVFRGHIKFRFACKLHANFCIVFQNIQIQPIYSENIGFSRIQKREKNKYLFVDIDSIDKTIIAYQYSLDKTSKYDNSIDDTQKKCCFLVVEPLRGLVGGGGISDIITHNTR